MTSFRRRRLLVLEDNLLLRSKKVSRRFSLNPALKRREPPNWLNRPFFPKLESSAAAAEGMRVRRI